MQQLKEEESTVHVGGISAIHASKENGFDLLLSAVRFYDFVRFEMLAMALKPASFTWLHLLTCPIF